MKIKLPISYLSTKWIVPLTLVVLSTLVLPQKSHALRWGGWMDFFLDCSHDYMCVCVIGNQMHQFEYSCIDMDEYPCSNNTRPGEQGIWVCWKQ